jgi:hypothetical protein
MIVPILRPWRTMQVDQDREPEVRRPFDSFHEVEILPLALEVRIRVTHLPRNIRLILPYVYSPVPNRYAYRIQACFLDICKVIIGEECAEAQWTPEWSWE